MYGGELSTGVPNKSMLLILIEEQLPALEYLCRPNDDVNALGFSV